MTLADFVTHVVCLWAGGMVGFGCAALLTSAGRADARMSRITLNKHGHAPDIECYYCKERGWR